MSDSLVGRGLYYYVGTWAGRPSTGTGTSGGLLPGHRAFFTDLNSKGEWDETEWRIIETAGAAHVNTGNTGISHNRNIAAAATTHPGDDSTNTATWTSAEGVTELSINSSAATGEALQDDDTYLVVINAPTAAIALGWLTDAGAVGQDVVYEMGILGEEKIIRRTSAITRVDVLPLKATTRFVIGAV